VHLFINIAFLFYRREHTQSNIDILSAQGMVTALGLFAVEAYMRMLLAS
jgi:hypothetical protein